MPGQGDQRPPDYDWLVRKVQLLEQQLRELSAARSLPASNFRGGRFRFQDDAGEPRWEMGNVALVGGSQTPTDAYGVFGRGDDAGIAFMLREGDRGLIMPVIPIPLHPPSTTVVTSSSFVTVVEAVMNLPAHEVVAVTGAVQTDASTTAELRLIDGYTGQTTGVASVPGSANGLYGFEWLHPASVGLYDQHPHAAAGLFLGLQARRVSGVGNVTVFWPSTAEMTSQFLRPGADTAGHPVFS